ncbi:four helix bundle protein [Flavobacterium sp.]
MKKSFELGKTIFHFSKAFPIEEKYSLTEQISRLSKSVSVNIVEST